MTVKTLPTKQLSVEEMSALYDRIYDIADRLLKKHNPCGIYIKDKKIYCLQYTYEKMKNCLGTLKLCCGNCWSDENRKRNYWSKGGCTTRCLACKLYACSYMKIKIRKRLNKLYTYAVNHLTFYYQEDGHLCRYPTAYKYFVSKQDWLKLLKESMNEKTHQSSS